MCVYKYVYVCRVVYLSSCLYQCEYMQMSVISEGKESSKQTNKKNIHEERKMEEISICSVTINTVFMHGTNISQKLKYFLRNW